MHISAALARQVWQRAGRRCEYCRIAQDFDDSPFEIDHIIPRKQGGPTTAGNLALKYKRKTRKAEPRTNRHLWPMGPVGSSASPRLVGVVV